MFLVVHFRWFLMSNTWWCILLSNFCHEKMLTCSISIWFLNFELLNGLIRNRKRGRIIVNQIEFSITTFINLFHPHFKKWYFRNCIFLWFNLISRITVYTSLYSSDMCFVDISTYNQLLSHAETWPPAEFFVELMLSSCWIFSHHWINAL